MNFRILVAAGVTLAGMSLVSVGCGSSTSVDGTIEGASFAAADAISADLPQVFDTYGTIFITSEAGMCGLVAKHATRKGLQTITVGVGDFDPATKGVTPPKKPGQFAIVDPHDNPASSASGVAFVSYNQLGDTCQPAIPGHLDGYAAQSGTVTIDAIDSGSYSGSGDVTLTSGDHITFTFSATACASLTGMATGTPTCQ